MANLDYGQINVLSKGLSCLFDHLSLDLGTNSIDKTVMKPRISSHMGIDQENDDPLTRKHKHLIRFVVC